MKTANIIRMICLLISIQAFGQQSDNSAIKVGQKIPDFELRDIINYPKKSAKVSEFQGKNLILDFWGTFCVPCIKSLPKIESLQNSFKDQLQIMMIGVESKERVENFYKHRVEQGAPIQLPTAVGPELAKSIGIREIPHYIWVDKGGIVLAITGQAEVSEENIRKFVLRQELNLPVKNDVYLPFNSEMPFLINGNGGDGSSLLYHSVLSEYVDGMRAMSYPVREPDQRRVFSFNSSIKELYQIAYGNIPFNRVDLELTDSSKYMNMRNGDFDAWKANNTYCYELIVPESQSDSILIIMQQDLKRLFGLIAKVERRTRECLVLTIDVSNDLLTKGGVMQRKINITDISLQNTSVEYLINIISHFMPNYIILNESGFLENIDLAFSASMIDLKQVQDALKNYGINLVKANREIDILVLMDDLQ